MKIEKISLIFIILIVLGIITYQLFRQSAAIKQDTAKAQIACIESAIDTFLQNTGYYPETLDELINDPGLVGWQGPYLKESQLLDPWGREFIYYAYSGGYEIISLGADGIPGGEGDNRDIPENEDPYICLDPGTLE